MAVVVDEVHGLPFVVAQHGGPERLHVGDDKGLDGDFDHLYGARVGDPLSRLRVTEFRDVDAWQFGGDVVEFLG